MFSEKWVIRMVFVFMLFIMIGLDFYKSYKEEKPPFPLTMVGDKAVAIILGEYQWNDKPKNIKQLDDLLKNGHYSSINPLDPLSIIFEEEKPQTIKVSFLDTRYEIDIPLYEGEYNKAFKNGIDLPNEPGPLLVTVDARWKNDKRGTFYLPLERKKIISYQELLSELEGTFSLYMVNPSEGDEKMIENLVDVGAIPFSRYKSTDDLKLAQIMYPDLKLTSSPNYIVLNDKEVLLQTDNKNTLMQFFESHYKKVKLNLNGAIIEVDREQQIVNLEGRKFYSEEIARLKVGQLLNATVTFNHPIDPFQTIVHSFEVVTETPGILLTN